MEKCTLDRTRVQCFEGLAFLKNGQAFFASCSHEGFCLIDETLYQKG